MCSALPSAFRLSFYRVCLLLTFLPALGCSVTGPVPADRGQGLAPVAEERRARLAEAMEGLRYEGERIEPDGHLPVGSDPAAAAALSTEGWRLLTANRFLEAIRSFTDAVLASAGEPGAYLGLGRSLLSKGQAEEALAAFSTALRLSPGDADARYWRGATLQQLDRRQEAADSFRELLRIDAGQGRAHARLAALSYYLGDLDSARAHLRQARRLEAPVPEVLAQLLATGRLPHAETRTGGPTVGPQIRIDQGGSARANEISAAGVPSAAGGEIVATWNDYRDPGGAIQMGVSSSVDGGATWVDRIVRPPAANQSSVEGDPMTAFDAQTGDLWVGAISFGGNGGVYVARKTPGANTFEPSVMTRVGGADKGWMAAGAAPAGGPGRRLYVAYDRGLQSSSDLGETWTPVSFVTSGLGFLPRVGGQGRLYLSFWDLDDGFFLLRSDDGGSTFGGTVRIATRMDPWGVFDSTRVPGTFRVPPLVYLALDPADDTLYAVYFDTTSVDGAERDVDLYFTRSTDQGDTWTTPRIVGPAEGQPGDQFFPWLEVDAAGRLHMVFLDTRNAAQSDASASAWIDAYYATSSDQGDTWTEFRLTPASWNSATEEQQGTQFIGDYMGLALAGHPAVPAAFPVYLSSQNGDSDIFTHVVGTDPVPFFSDGFESGDLGAWSQVLP
ncbi:MAG: tetratricopeptide repeat protein [Acidobacteria bacterium]|nr:tetratricopeptide repeat protein [Acidobacteriota bacterium]